ncbi:coiled-coil domain-containing protein 158 isoform X2 [Cynoglossus semilaevis]|uniref:Coiled-coil domain containing 158 n=1 Tax=Cynoglossus semilaevis TaxID=244447 RepID=A0A3P8WQ13_CYNSE|nr:coiled-coil domain-containing protein 158 isoform X2 [Cynoglossus semilaevis]
MAGTFDSSVLEESLHNNDEPMRETGRKSEVHEDSIVLRLHRMTPDELSEELNRRIRETQKLQEEVENATKVTLERFGCKYSINNSPGPSSLNYTFNALTQPQDYSLDSPEKVVSQKAVENSVPHLLKPQSKLHQVQMENVVLSDLRLNDSREHVDQMEQMLCMLEELQKIKRATDDKLQEREDETLTLGMKVNTLEEMMKEMYSALLSHKIQSRNSDKGSLSGQPTSADLNSETDRMQTANHMDIYGDSAKEQNHRMREMITDLCQEMALLSDKLSSSNQSSFTLSHKLEILRKLAERQTSLHQCQINDLESTLSDYKDKGCSEQQQHEFQVEAKVLRGRLEEARNKLHRAEEEKSCLQALLNERTHDGSRTQKLLHGKEKELELKHQEARQHRSQFHTLQVEAEMLRLKLDDREKQIDCQKLQIEISSQMTMQQSHTIDHLQQDRNIFIKQLEQLKAELDQHKSDLAASEHEKKLLQMCVSGHNQRVQEESGEKQQLTTQLEVQRIRYMTLSKELEELQRLHSCKEAEQEGVVLRLQEQLRSTCEELDKVRSTLRTLEGADGCGLQVAMDMQKEVTARREQADSLQSKIQHLEETVKELQQEEHNQSLQQQLQHQELTLAREEKKHLKQELQLLRSKDQKLLDQINNLGSFLHRLSESFAGCQDFIQLQEQDFYHLKLQHALDLKELQGQTLYTAVTVLPTDQDSPNPAVFSTPPSAQRASTTWMKVGHTQELRSLVKELQGAISENHRPHTDNSAAASRLYRRRSAPPEKTHRTTFKPLKNAELKGKTVPKKPVGDGCTESSPGTSFLEYLSLGRRSPVHSLLTSDPNS